MLEVLLFSCTKEGNVGAGCNAGLRISHKKHADPEKRAEHEPQGVKRKTRGQGEDINRKVCPMRELYGKKEFLSKKRVGKTRRSPNQVFPSREEWGTLGCGGR